MKLYATTTSERASKGQGGNKFIDIKLKVGSRDNQIDAGNISLEVVGDRWELHYLSDFTPLNGSLLAEGYLDETKGNKQKGEIAQQLADDREQDAFNAGMQGEWCENCKKEIVTDNMGTCSICKHDK